MNEDKRTKQDFPKGVGTFIAGFSGIFIVSALLGLGLTGVLIWGFIRLVLHFT
jgi:hypothetical protein